MRCCNGRGDLISDQSNRFVFTSLILAVYVMRLEQLIDVDRGPAASFDINLLAIHQLHALHLPLLQAGMSGFTASW